MRRVAAGIVASWLAAACLVVAKPPGGIWLDVPYVRQPKNGCGAASIAMIIEYWRRHDPRFHAAVPDVNAIQRALYSPQAHGILASGLEAYLRRQGLRVFVFRGDWNAMEDHLSNGRPLIVCLREGGTLHYVVVAGLDATNAMILVNDPATRKLAPLSRAAFEKKWSREDDWTLLALPQPRE